MHIFQIVDISSNLIINNNKINHKRMKKFFLGMFTLTVVALSAGFTSCSSDDGDSGGGGDVNKAIPSTTPRDANGNYIRLTSVRDTHDGDISFTYDASGRLTGYSTPRFSNVTVNGNKIIYTSDESWGDGYERDKVEYILSLNSDGLITAFSLDEREEYKDNGEDPEIVTTKGTISFDYNSQKQLTKMTGSAIIQHEEDGEKWSYKTDFTQTYTWSGGNLLRVERTLKSDGDEEYGEESTTILAYSYGSKANTSKQYPFSVGVEAVGGSDVHMCLALLGYFGVGPVNLPTGYSETYIERFDEEFDDYNYDYTVSYTQNSDGTIATEKVSRGNYYNRTLTYSYTTVPK